MALARSIPAAPVPSPSDLATRVRGSVLEPGSDEYERIRVAWNRSFDRRPLAIVQPVDARDVAEVVRFARAHGLEIAVRSGGHSIAGHSTTDGGVLVDLGALRGLHLDPAGRTAWAGAGLTAGEVTRAAGEHGLAVPFGDTASVGIGGLTLGGGIGWLARKHGLAIDNLLAAELVTASGETVTVSADRHPDLFWAIRGGGGNFGIVTRFQFRLVPVGMVYGGAIALPLTAETLTGLVAAADAAPDALTTISFVMSLPPAPFVPAEHVGRTALIVTAVYDGDAEAGAAALEPIRNLGTPLAEALGPMPYPAIYQFTAGADLAHASLSWSTFADELPADLAAGIVERLESPAGAGTMFQLRVLGGAMSRVPAGSTAFAHRARKLMFVVSKPFGETGEPEATTAFVQAFADLLSPVARGVYANFVGDEGESRVHDAYPPATYERLAALKARYDPTNLFHLNQNIRPR